MKSKILNPKLELIQTNFEIGKKLCKSNQAENAKDYLNFCLLKLAELTLEGVTQLGKLTVDQWKDRCWLLLEKYELLDCGDCSDLNL